MAKKKEAIEEGEVAAPSAIEAVGNDIFVNRDKLTRARDIVELVSGKRAPRDEGEADRKERFTAHFATHEVNPKSATALRFVYETLLGGLVRTEEEQEAADSAAVAARRKHKKKQVEE